MRWLRPAGEQLTSLDGAGKAVDNQWQRPPRVHLFLGAAFSLAFVLLIGWLIHIPYAKVDGSQTLAQKAERQQVSHSTLQPYRGPIVDCKGRPLAAMIEAYDIFADPVELQEGRKKAVRVHDESDPRLGPVVALTNALHVDAGYNENRKIAAEKLAPALGMNVATVDRLIADHAGKRFVYLKRRVDLPTKEAVEALHIWGVGTQSDGKRCYPNGELGAHFIGVTGYDNQGLTGLELHEDQKLQGEPGFRKVEMDGKRRPIWIQLEGYRPTEDGQVLMLTIDLTIQAFTEEALEKAVKQYKGKGGSALVMNPETGEILALANYPTFDPTDIAAADAYALRNRLATDPYEPGSTFKCFVSSVALEEGVVHKGEQIFCHNGLFLVHGRRLTDVHPYGTLTFENVVVKSSNIGMGIIGDRMGNARLYEAVRRFGFGERTGVPLPGEGPGLVHPLAKWSGLSATSIPMGYELLVTPLQLITAFSAIANGGTLMKPRLIHSVYGPDGRLTTDMSQPIPVRRVLRQDIADYMRRSVLREVCVSGTGKEANIPGFDVFGKTGTAVKRNPNGGGYSRDLYVGSFIGGAPLNHPRVVAFVLIDEPNRSVGHFGGTVAAPAVAEILQKSLGYLRIAPEEPEQQTHTARVAVN
jgi:cell division protein FtsI (penicillin-binding protein 3)